MDYVYMDNKDIAKEIEERLQINDFFVKDIMEKGSVLYER